jgi:uncharacterized protein YjiS (DUF1127 family)
MIMSMTLTALVAPEARAARSRFGELAVTLRCRWAVYVNWRIEHAAIVQLRAMSDRKLKDIGLTRSPLAETVRGEPGSEARLQALLLSTPESILS